MTKKITSSSLAVLLFLGVFITVFLGSVSAMNDDQNLSGIVWTSSGDFPSNPPSNSTEFCIWVEHNNLWYRFPGTGWAFTQVGADGYWWYSYVLPNEDYPDKWAHGDRYRVQVNGEPWGDYNGNTTSNGTGSSGDPIPPLNPLSPASTYNTINYSALGGFENEQQWDVRTVAQIDLAPTNVTANGVVPVDGIPVPPNTPIPIFFNVTNYGSSDSGDFRVTLWNCSSTGINQPGLPFMNFSVSSLSPYPLGDTGVLGPFYWLSPSIPGEYYVNITVDSLNEIAEFDEANNRKIIHFVTGPDLNITNVLIWGSVPEDPYYVFPGELLQIFANVTNEGQSTTGGSFILALYNITGPNGPIILGHQSFNYSIGELDILKSAERSWYWTAPIVEGDYWVNITADYGDQIVEGNELNNHYTIHFNVTRIPITKINHTEPYYNLPFQTYWYINSSTEIYFTIMGEFPPFYTYYRILWASNNSEAKGWTNFTEGGSVPFTLEDFDLGEDTYKIEFYSIDSVGGTEQTKNKIVIVDDSVPRTSINFEIPKYRDADSDCWNITSATNMTLSAVDYPLGLNTLGMYNAAGLDGIPESGIFYRIQNLSTGLDVVALQEYTPGLKIRLDDPAWGDGYYRIWYNSTDNLLQKEMNYTDVYLDNNGPITAIDWPHTQNDWNVNQNAWNIDFSIFFTLSADDGLGSGVDYIEYRIRIDETTWTSWFTYSTSFNLTLDTHGYWDHTIQFRSMDNLGNLGPTDTLDVYIEGDITPPLPPTLKVRVSGDDIILEWEHSPDPDVDHYLIYRSTTKTGFNFSKIWVDTSNVLANGVDPIDGLTIPLRTTWNDTGAVSGATEYYYTMRGVDSRNNIGYTSNIAGKVTMTFKEGYNDLALPLEPYEEIRASEMLSQDVFADVSDTLFRYNAEIQQWMGHPKFLPSTLDDFVLEMGQGYMLLLAEDVEYTFTGSVGTAIRYIGGVGEENEFRESIAAFAQDNEVSLLWMPSPTATGYSIYRATVRMGTGSLTDYTIQPIAEVSEDTTSWTDSEATANEYFYMVVAKNGHGEEESGTYALGVVKYELNKEYNSFSFKLEPDVSETLASFCEENLPIVGDAIFYYDSETGSWQGHPKFLPENINNGNAVTGKCYMIFTYSEITKFAIIGV